jgi:ferrous iron transport protein A
LIEMGCLPGNTVQLIQKAPFNDPLYLNIDGAHLAIRNEIAQHIFVRLVD